MWVISLIPSIHPDKNISPFTIKQALDHSWAREDRTNVVASVDQIQTLKLPGQSPSAMRSLD